MPKVKIEELLQFSTQALIQSGMTADNAAAAAKTLVTTDTFGVLSHGTKNLYGYIQKMKAGGLDATAVPTMEKEGAAWGIVNGNAAIGMLTADFAMSKAIEKAKKTGIAYVGVHNSCHFGAAGYYANMAAAAGMIGLSMSNGDPVMAVPNSSGVVIGNNPFAFAAPLANGRSVFLDIALSNVAALKVVMAKEKGIAVPDDWLVDKDGKPTNDPSGFPETSYLQPMAAHKGYGFAVLVEILASVLTGAGMLHEITSWNLDLPSKNKVGHAFIAVDIAQMTDMQVFEDRMEQMVKELKSAPKAKGAQEIFLPGEMDWNKREAALATGEIEVTAVMAENYEKLAALTGAKITIY